MAELERGSDHAIRIASLTAFETSMRIGVEAGLARIGVLDNPARVHAAILLLVQNHRFQDVVDLAASQQPHCKWIDLAVYANVALRDVASAKSLLAFALDYCEESWVLNRCRIAVADAVFSEILQDAKHTGLSLKGGLSDEDRLLLEFVIATLNPLVTPVRLSGRVESSVQRVAVEFAANVYGLLGQLSQITDLVMPMVKCRPVPLLLAQLVLRKLCEPPSGLSGRIRVEHPNSFSAHFVAALLDREVYDRIRPSLDSMIDLQQMARDRGDEAVEQLCQALFETASALDMAALARTRTTVDRLLGTPNRYRLLFDSVALLKQNKPDEALKELNAHPQDDDAVWWQIAAKAHELLNDVDKATECWERVSQLMPHPDLLTRFAGLSMQQRRFHQAVRALTLAAEQSPDDTRILEQLAFAHTRLGRFSDACMLYERLARLNPNEPRNRVNLALCQVRSGDPESALSSIDTVIDFEHPELQIIGLRAEILKSLNRPADAFNDLQRIRDDFWSNVRFLVLYMDVSYRAGRDGEAHQAFHQLMSMQHNGQLQEPLFQPISLDDLKMMGTQRFRQRESLFSEVAKGKLPWLAAEALMGAVADQAWYRRTQRLRWLSDDVSARGEWTIYATNSFSVQRDSNGRPSVLRIGSPRSGEAVVADISAIITLHRLGRLNLAADYFGKLVLPTSYGDLPVRDAQRLAPHQPSREQELRLIQDLVQRRLITVIGDGDTTREIPLVDEYHDDAENQRFAMADVAQLLRVTQRLTSEELDDFARVCHRPTQSNRELPLDRRILFAIGTLRTMARYPWIERLLPTVDWCVARDDYDNELHELQDYEFQRSILGSHQGMWKEINQLRADGKLEYRDSRSLSHDRDSEDDGEEPSPFLDALTLAMDERLRLLADDRLLQSAVLNQNPEVSDAAFGADLLILGLESSGSLTAEDVCGDLIKMMRWRYRFLLPDSRHLIIAALRSRDNLPGPELRDIAAYVQESMRDPGLFCGPENADLPTPVAFKYYMAWKELCVEFLGSLWSDPEFTAEQLRAVTVWCVGSLLPAVPRGMLYSPVGRRLANLTPKAFLLTAMIRFAAVEPLQRANEALRLMAAHLGMTEDEFYEAAAEAADGRYD
ncbi:tetratricopeptide repeat protein [Schlesneria sp. T3-172]|uniref:tetratricopeptide repeat protein n=1 Tax=Schlesneria sphaerica TaxID=3373610 RepID=UPI0037C64CBC